MDKKYYVLGIILAGVLCFWIISWNRNSEADRKIHYLTARQEQCILVGEKEKLSLKQFSDASGQLISTGSYIYAENIDDCIFERAETLIVKGNSSMTMTITGLFSGKRIISQMFSLEEDENVNSKKNCEFYNQFREKYFPNGINCSFY